MAHGFGDLLRTGTGAAVEHQLERLAVGEVDHAGGAGQLALGHCTGHSGLNLTKQGRAQFDHTRLV